MVSLSPHFCAVVTIAKIPIKGIPMEIISLWLHQGFLPHRVVVYRQREREHFTQADTGPQTKQGLGHYKDKPKCRSSVQKKKKKSLLLTARWDSWPAIRILRSVILIRLFYRDMWMWLQLTYHAFMCFCVRLHTYMWVHVEARDWYLVFLLNCSPLCFVCEVCVHVCDWVCMTTSTCDRPEDV